MKTRIISIVLMLATGHLCGMDVQYFTFNPANTLPEKTVVDLATKLNLTYTVNYRISNDQIPNRNDECRLNLYLITKRTIEQYPVLAVSKGHYRDTVIVEEDQIIIPMVLGTTGAALSYFNASQKLITALLAIQKLGKKRVRIVVDCGQPGTEHSQAWEEMFVAAGYYQPKIVLNPLIDPIEVVFTIQENSYTFEEHLEKRDYSEGLSKERLDLLIKMGIIPPGIKKEYEEKQIAFLKKALWTVFICPHLIQGKDLDKQTADKRAAEIFDEITTIKKIREFIPRLKILIGDTDTTPIEIPKKIENPELLSQQVEGPVTQKLTASSTRPTRKQPPIKPPHNPSFQEYLWQLLPYSIVALKWGLGAYSTWQTALAVKSFLGYLVTGGKYVGQHIQYAGKQVNNVLRQLSVPGRVK
jgi:hypothetical protein